MDIIIDHLEKTKSFTIAHIKELKFKRVHTFFNDPIKNTYYIHCSDEPLDVVTSLNGVTETKSIVKRGDIVITGPYKERYVVACMKFFTWYDVIDEVAIKKTQSRSVAHVPSSVFKELGLPLKPLTFKAPWGEDMIFEHGDYLVKEGPGVYYRIEKRAFERTYTFQVNK